LLATGLSVASLAAQNSDTSKAVVLEGRVIDAASGNPLPGARVTTTGSVNATSTDRDGRFRVLSSATGSVTLTVSYLGRTDQTRTLSVEPGAVVHVDDVTLAPPGYQETVVVEGSLISDADARALNEQKTAPNITNVVSADQIGSLPDRNAAETTQRIAG